MTREPWPDGGRGGAGLGVGSAGATGAAPLLSVSPLAWIIGRLLGEFPSLVRSSRSPSPDTRLHSRTRKGRRGIRYL
jgi:hypothetical protein